MHYEFIVENIKCGGCANSIQQALQKITGVDKVTVDVGEGRVSVDGDENLSHEEVVSQLSRMGYPEPGKGSVVTTVNSFVSCMVGRLS